MTAPGVEVDGHAAPASAAQASAAAERLLARWPSARPFLLVGSGLVVVGGFVAAVTRPTGFDLGPWLAAFLVLVGGVAQIALGVGQAWIAEQPPVPRDVRIELVSWNTAVVLTAVGSLASLPVATLLGGVAMVVALVRFLVGVAAAGSVPRSAIAVYRIVAAVVLVSTPIGLVLSVLRHG
ncbi:MAG: hypothetical protein JST64_09435 [Actinobacteria bacterium]|nr:hypothetical protein [Actinomycetota bacterium]